jgi:hypothetical protein
MVETMAVATARVMAHASAAASASAMAAATARVMARVSAAASALAWGLKLAVA